MLNLTGIACILYDLHWFSPRGRGTHTWAKGREIGPGRAGSAFSTPTTNGGRAVRLALRRSECGALDNTTRVI